MKFKITLVQNIFSHQRIFTTKTHILKIISVCLFIFKKMSSKKNFLCCGQCASIHSFSRKRNLKRHEEMVTRDKKKAKTVSCNSCHLKAFKSQKTLKEHMRRYHNEIPRKFIIQFLKLNFSVFFNYWKNIFTVCLSISSGLTDKPNWKYA
jgi:hypothetical protein